MNSTIDQCSLHKCGETATEDKLYIKPEYCLGENEDGHYVELSLPGVKKDTISIAYETNQLTVIASRKSEASSNWKVLRKEYCGACDYHLVLDLNFRADTEKITANAVNGILRIELPFAEEAKPQAIKVS